MTEDMNKNVLNESELDEVTGGAQSFNSYVYYTVVANDNLSRIAKRFGSTVRAICNANPIIKDKNLIRVGWELKIPVNK